MSPSSNHHRADKRLLQDFEDEKRAVSRDTSRLTLGFVPHLVYLTTIFCLLTSHFALVVSRRGQSDNVREDAVLGRSQFAGLSYDTPVVFTKHSDYMSANETVAYNAWTDISTDSMVVALTDEYAAAHNIERSQLRFIWDESKGIYFLKLFHNLHCLKSMRKAFTDLKNGVTDEHAQWHFHHCLDSLRQDLLCQADDTPMPLVQLPESVGYGQTRMCRNYDALVAWTEDVERNACYRRFSDYRRSKHKIEMYAFCPEDSPYYEVSQRYFEKWGHLDVFGVDEEEQGDTV